MTQYVVMSNVVTQNGSIFAGDIVDSTSMDTAKLATSVSLVALPNPDVEAWATQARAARLRGAPIPAPVVQYILPPTQFKARAVVTTLQAYGGTGTGTLTESANGAISAADGVTLAVGDIVFIQEGTTNLTAAKDAGPWQVVALGDGSNKWSLIRPSWWTHGAAVIQGVTIELGGEGTAYAGTSWKSFAGTGKLVGTDAPVFWPKAVQGSTALVGGTFTISAPVRSTTKTAVSLARIATGGTVTSTIRYCPTSAGANGLTAGVIGVGQVVVQATVAAGTIANTDTSTLAWRVQNW